MEHRGGGGLLRAQPADRCRDPDAHLRSLRASSLPCDAGGALAGVVAATLVMAATCLLGRLALIRAGVGPSARARRDDRVGAARIRPGTLVARARYQAAGGRPRTKARQVGRRPPRDGFASSHDALATIRVVRWREGAKRASPHAPERADDASDRVRLRQGSPRPGAVFKRKLLLLSVSCVALVVIAASVSAIPRPAPNPSPRPTRRRARRPLRRPRREPEAGVAGRREPPGGRRRPRLLRQVLPFPAERRVVFPDRRLVGERYITGRRGYGQGRRAQSVRHRDRQQSAAPDLVERNEGDRATERMAHPGRRGGRGCDRGLGALRRDRHGAGPRGGLCRAGGRSSHRYPTTAGSATTTTARASLSGRRTPRRHGSSTTSRTSCRPTPTGSRTRTSARGRRGARCWRAATGRWHRRSAAAPQTTAPRSTRVRDLVSPAGSKPVWAFVEVGHPFTESHAPSIQPAEVRRRGLAEPDRRGARHHLLQPQLRRPVPEPARPARPLLRADPGGGQGHEPTDRGSGLRAERARR